MKDLKYLAAFTIPLSAFLGIYLQGYYSYLTPVYAFGIIPVLEMIFPMDNSNLSSDAANEKKLNPIFDWLLYFNIPIVYGLLLFALLSIVHSQLLTFEYIGLVLTVGIVLGVNGINVAHELGHRLTSPERYLGKILLLPSHYMHFFIEHNFGHHLHAATPEDPATARYNQTVYTFWITSSIRQYFSAWRIQLNLLQYKKQSFISLKNDMLWYVIFQLTYLMLVFAYFGMMGLVFATLAGIVGFILLETVNYIEHYGLIRFKNDSGRYERVKAIHSWNSNHIIGRIVLYELTRHSDHHYKSNKKYQLLECHEDSPQMPYGYPTSMVLAMLPPLWFKVMNGRVPKKMVNK